MKLYLSAALLLVLASSLLAQNWNNPSAELLQKSVGGVLIPRIDFEKTSGVECLEFIRSRIWDTHFFERESTRPAFEYRCSPDRLMTALSLKTTNVTVAKALDEVCEKLGISWAIGEGKIVFTNAEEPQNAKPNAP